MGPIDRRSFIKLAGGAAATAAVPLNITRALEIPARRSAGTIKDVKHIVIVTQENRSFDHYFGTLRGVRGFGDPHPARLPSGRPVWRQPSAAGDVLPFRPPVANLGATFLSDPPHGWTDTHAAWNGGRHDQFVPQKGLTAMTYHTRPDLPYHYALADAFTVCDAYHCSVLGPTDPNRYHLWTGWLGNDGKGGGPVITNAEAGYDWSSYPERLEKAGISWKVYQDIGVGLTAAGSWGWTGDKPYIGNYGDNALLYLHQYQNAAAGSPLANGAKTGTEIAKGGGLFDQLRADVKADRLPQVSWIAAPEAYTEHPNWPPNYGAWYLSNVIDTLVANPDVWASTVLLVNWDEEGGFFDHMVPPTPPATPAAGASTIDPGNEIYAGDPSHPAGPIGLGMRVPLLAVSPWSKGGWVNSQLFDHTSVIRFIEARFADEHAGLVETNITPWRRAVTGDLTSAFDFTHEGGARVALPSTAGFEPPDRTTHPDFPVAAPADPAMPVQERGGRPARPLPYELRADVSVDPAAGAVSVAMANTGRVAAVFHARSADPAQPPRTYTVEAGRSLTGIWTVGTDTGRTYDVSIHGPNGFFRRFQGGLGPARALLDVSASHDANRLAVTVSILNRGDKPALMRMAEQFSGDSERERLEPGRRTTRRWSLGDSQGWYEIQLTTDDAAQRCVLSGHVENGRPSTSDPRLGGVAGVGDGDD